MRTYHLSLGRYRPFALLPRGGAQVNPLPNVRVGIDVVSVDEVAASIERFGDRYLQRVYTPHELDACRGGGYVRASRLAARFAAKEAVMKVLRPDDSSPGWRDIEIWRQEPGWCEVRLHGSAADLAAAAGLGQVAVSITHAKDVAAAVAVAVAPDA